MRGRAGNEQKLFLNALILNTTNLALFNITLRMFNKLTGLEHSVCHAFPPWDEANPS
jgi:hypothetical protein